MGTFICPGYEGHPCGVTVERTAPNHKFCRECSQEREKVRDASHSAYYYAHKEEIKAREAAYRASHKKEIKARKAAHNAAHKEQQSVRKHHQVIFGTKKTPPRKSYESMPFCDTWNPKKGGSYKAGGDWIIANLGRKPEGCSLHVVDHAKGFVPGNLEWTHPVKQNAEQMFKIIARQRHQIKELQIENQKLRAEIQEANPRAA